MTTLSIQEWKALYDAAIEFKKIECWNWIRELDTGFTVSISKVIGVEVENSPGELYRIAEVLGNQQINVKYCYASISGNEKAMLIFWVDNIKKAVKVLEKEGITLKREPV